VKQKEEQLKKKFSRPSDDDEAQDGAVGDRGTPASTEANRRARGGMGGGEALHQVGPCGPNCIVVLSPVTSQVEATVQQLPNATKQRVKGPSGRRLPSKKTAEVSEADEGISASLNEYGPTLPGPKKSVVEAVERFASLAAGLSPLPCEALSSSGPRAEAPVRLESSSDATADIRDLVVARKFVLCFCTLGEAHCDCPGELGFEGPGLARGRLVQCQLLTDPLNGTVLEQRLEVAGWDEARPNELRLGLKATEKGVSMEGLIVLEVTRAVVMVKRRKKLSLEWKATFEGVVMKFSSAKHKEKKLGRVKVDKVTMVMWQLAEREEPEPGRWSPGRGLDEDVEDDEEVILGEVFDENEEGNNEIDETIEESKATDEEEDIEETDGEEEDYEDDYIKETDEEFEDEQDGETDVSTDSPACRGEQLGAEKSPGEGSDGSMSSDDEEFNPEKLVAKEAKEEYDSNPSDTDGDSDEEEDSSEEEG
jgi:hypothetical protein